MTAKDLHAMTAPLFAKHPSAKPEQLRYIKECWYWEPDTGALTTKAAALIIQGHLVEWLAEHGRIEFCNWSSNEKAIYHGGRIKVAPTLLKSLIAACMEVEQ